MAQLPPKIPATISPHWAPSFSPFTGDFLDSGKGSHRRSMSDSVAFLDAAPFMHSPAGNCFDRIDDDQLISMFSDELTGAAAAAPATGNSSSPSSPSDQDSNCEDKHMAIDHQPPELLEVADPKRVKRILANRQSAQRSRVRKLQYISELERSVTTLQTEVSALSPRVAYLDHQRLLLNVDNSSLKQRLAALAQDKIFKDAHQEALKKEIERLRQKYNQQNMKKMAKEYNYNMNDNTTQLQAAASNSSNIACTTKEHLIITS